MLDLSSNVGNPRVGSNPARNMPYFFVGSVIDSGNLLMIESI